MLFNIVTSIFIIFITKKIYYFTFLTKMENFHLRLGMYGLNVYTYMYLFMQKIISFFNFTYTYNSVVINLIKDGNLVKECTLDQLKLHIETINKCDLILYKDRYIPSDKYTYNILRLDKNKLLNNDFTYNESNIRFINIQIFYKAKKYNVDFSKDNYYINNNVLFDRAFVKWYLNVSYGVFIDGSEDYTYTIMDQEVNFISLDSSSKIIIENDGYSIEKNKVDEKLDTVHCDINNDSIESGSENFGYNSNLKTIDNVS